MRGSDVQQAFVIRTSALIRHSSFGFRVSRVIVGSVFGWLKRLIEREGELTLGARGENVAAKFLRNLGYRIIQRNFKCPLGEIDIIARDDKTLVFVEVKTRTADEPTPETQVNPFKQHQITKVAKLYLSRYGNAMPPARFDIVAIVWPTGREPQIRHTVAAFEGTF